MALPYLLPVALLAGLLAASAAPRADDLSDALIDAYLGNPQLLAARRELAARDTLRPQALAGWLPRVTLSGGIGRSRTVLQTETPSRNRAAYDSDDRNAQIQFNLNLYRGGTDLAQLDRAELLILAQRASLQQVEQRVLLDAVEASFDIVRDRRILELRALNRDNLGVLLNATQVQYDLGERTEADLAQAQSRTAQAEAALAQARAALTASSARFETAVGRPPGDLSRMQPVSPVILSVEELERGALEDSPSVLSARFQAEAAERSRRAIQGEMLPSVTLNANAGYQKTGAHDPAFRQIQDRGAVGVQVNVPLYQAGQVGARVREAREVEAQRRHDLDHARRQAVELARRSRQTLIAADERRTALVEAVRAAEVAIDSLRREAEFGQRSLIDILDAQQELIEAQVNLANAERDSVAGRYNLLLTQGQLTAQALGLEVDLYDFEENYRIERYRVGPFD